MRPRLRLEVKEEMAADTGKGMKRDVRMAKRREVERGGGGGRGEGEENPHPSFRGTTNASLCIFWHEAELTLAASGGDQSRGGFTVLLTD